jgi:transposase
MSNVIFSIGIDVSKDHLDCCYNTTEGSIKHLKVSNNTEGFKHLMELTGFHYQVVVEASGPYYLALAFYLKDRGAEISVENSLQVKRYIQSQGERNKSDKKDAYWIWHYSQHRACHPWREPSAEQLKCQQLLKGIELYTRQQNMLGNQLHALQIMPIRDKIMVVSLQKMLNNLNKEIQKLEAALDKLLESWVPDQVSNLRSIPGLGKRAVALLIVFTDGFEKVNNYRQLISLAGLSPKEYSSGSSVRGKVRICKMGGGALRNVLYMCSMSAIKYNSTCKALYERLKSKGKNGKLALIAVCNKLLKQAFAIAKSNISYSENFSSKKLAF